MTPKGIIKLAISAVMLGIVLRVVDFGSLASTFATIPPWVAIVAIIGFSFTQAYSAVKWWILARAGGIEVRLPVAIRAFFAGMFANCFGFGTIGGDMLRGVLIAGRQKKRAEAIASVFADRALGLAVLSAIGVLATAFSSSGLGGTHHLDDKFVYALFGVASCIMLGWIVGPFIVLKLVPKNWALRQKVEQVVSVFPKKPGTVLLLITISATFHLMQIGLHWVIARGLGIDVSFTSMLIAIPFVNIISTLPFSWQGVGVRENAYIFFLYPDVFSKEQALAVGAIWLLSLTSSSIIGGFWAVLTGDITMRGEARNNSPQSDQTISDPSIRGSLNNVE